MSLPRRHHALFCALLAAGPASAQAPWPQKPIRWIVDFPAGGVSDTIARTVSGRWSEMLGQPLVVDPRPGAGGMLAYGLAARAVADGHTLAFVSAPFVLLPTLHARAQYKVSDLVPVGLIGTAPNVLVSATRVPAQGVRDLVVWARTRGDAVNFASVGIGSGPHLSAEQFNQIAGLRGTHVPYTGSGPALNELMAGRVDYLFVNLPSAIPLVKAGKINLLGVGSERRLATLPDLPTVAEGGVAGFRSVGFYGAAVPAGVPSAILGRLRADLATVVAAPDVRERLLALGAEPPPERFDFAGFLAEETERWSKVIRDARIRIDAP